MNISRTENFKRAWIQLNDEQKKLAVKAIEQLVTDFRYPALRVKKIKGTENIWEARVSKSIRITFQREKSTILLRNIGQHDETIGRP
jgi:mRNA-degrading endonuclease RelE of RelBE toxin-antitoxin system